MEGREDTGQFLLVKTDPDLRLPRARRDTLSPTQIKLSALLAAVALAITIGGLVWAMRAELSEKADRETVQQLRIDLEILKSRIKE